VEITEKGNGYIVSEPPRIGLQPPEDRDWMVTYSDENETVSAVVKDTNARLVYPFEEVSLSTLNKLQNDPTLLLPLSARPMIQRSQELVQGVVPVEKVIESYYIPGMPSFPSRIELPSSQYAAYDPILGGVGIAPVTKGALSLSASQYARLALSGAICTVIVRTLLNPLELIKTKIQLGNDVDLLKFVQKRNTPLGASRDQGAPAASDAGSCASELAHQRRREVVTSSGDLASENLNSPPPKSKGPQTLATSHRQKIDKSALGDTTETHELHETGSGLSTISVARGLVELRGPAALFQGADITLLASLVFGGLGFGATELFRRFFTSLFFEVEGDGQTEAILLGAAALATLLTAFAATPFELLRVRSMGLVEGKPWRDVLTEFLVRAVLSFLCFDLPKVCPSPSNCFFLDREQAEKRNERARLAYYYPDQSAAVPSVEAPTSSLQNIAKQNVKDMFQPFPKIVSRELPFALAKFLAFDLVAKLLEGFVNSSHDAATPVQVGVGVEGLAISAFSGAIAGLAGAVVSHPADLVLTLTSAASKSDKSVSEVESGALAEDHDISVQWQDIVRGLLAKEGGVRNLFAGLPARLIFFFLVIGLQFFLYDYVKTLLSVGSDDLSLVLDVFYAVRQGLTGAPAV
jgi:hypothetical protein